MDELSRSLARHCLDRLAMAAPLDGTRTPAELLAAAGETVTETGLGADAVRLWTDVLAPACLSVDHPKYLSFIPNAPSKAAAAFDMLVGASSVYGGSWLEGSGAVFAENQALRWIADLAGLPAEAGGVFVQGGTVGNLSALVAARETAKVARAVAPARWAVCVTTETHSSVKHALAVVMDVDVIEIPEDERGRMTGAALREVLAGLTPAQRDGIFAVVATAGSTNLGVVDDIAGVGAVARENGWWLHVDGAYGGAGLAAPSVRHLFDGIEQADSFIVDPHKWLFAPYDCCALIYRNPVLGRAAHTQHAGYLDPVTVEGEWNPSDFAIQLTRRARGLPFWFSPRRERDPRLPGCGRADDDRLPGRGRTRAGRGPPAPAGRARSLGRRVRADRLGRGGLRHLERGPTRSPDRVRHTDPPPRPSLHPIRRRQPADHRAGPGRHHRIDAIAGTPDA